jgi:hypothetical protein
LKETDFDRVAENSFTGIETSPKEILPLPAGRAAIGKTPPALTMVPLKETAKQDLSQHNQTLEVRRI